LRDVKEPNGAVLPEKLANALNFRSKKGCSIASGCRYGDRYGNFIIAQFDFWTSDEERREPHRSPGGQL
jgi:hypothetical protein